MAVVVSFVGKWDGKDLEKAQRELAQMGDSAQRQGSKMAAFGKTAAVAGIAAAAGVAAFAVSSVKAAQESVVADARLDNIAKSMKLVGGAYEGGTARLKDYASELSKSIGVEDESIKAVQSKLLTFKAVGKTINETGGAMDRATKAAYDLASAGFGSAESNATQLGKALQDPIKGIASLARSGVTFTQSEKDKMKALVESGQAGKAQEMILKAIETQVGNTAEKTATASQKMKVSFSELQEKVGMALLPVLNKLADTLGPMFDKLQGPLGKVAEALGGALSQAFDKLAPVLPVLAEAIGQIAGALGGVLATAIQALVPVVSPLLTLLGELGSKIGPILAPILEKIGTLLGAVLSAVMPLIEPLTEVILGILDAAAPILGVVVDALILLVNALAPVLGAVGQLIKPLGTLITVVLAALMPVLEPLLPVIDALATVLGDVLTRAVGVIMTALGYLIQGWAKLAPFILDNVAKPVVSIFLDMVEKIVDGAAAAFGWVPGLGDKLKGAADAVHGFKDSAIKAVGEAAKTIGTKGTEIGQGLVDNGIAMMTDPANAAKARNAGIGLGKDLASGVKQGVDASAAALGLSTAALMNHAEKAARDAAQTHSPSVVFANIGKDLVDGLVKGVQDGGKDVRKTLQETFTSWFSDTIQTLKDKLKEAEDSFKSFKDEVSAAITGGIDFSGAAQEFDEQGNKVGKSFIEKLTEQAEQAKNFAMKVKELIAAGLSREALTQVLSAGVTAGTSIANELIAGGANAIATTNELVSSTQAAADAVGLLAAGRWEQAGVDQAQATYLGFKKNFGKDGPARAALMDLMDNLASSMNRSATITVTTINRTVSQVVNGARAAGGPVSGGGLYLVGESGPELLQMGSTGGNIIPNNQIGSASVGGGNTYNITVQAGVGDPRQIGQEVVQYIKRFEQANGPVFASA